MENHFSGNIETLLHNAYCIKQMGFVSALGIMQILPIKLFPMFLHKNLKLPLRKAYNEPIRYACVCVCVCVWCFICYKRQQYIPVMTPTSLRDHVSVLQLAQH